jgi:predicted RNA-binding protein YlqC (UPF0109 family)
MPKSFSGSLPKTQDIVLSTTSMIAEIARIIVKFPDCVLVHTHSFPDATLLILRVDPADRLAVTGKQGRTARSFRVMLGSVSRRTGHRFSLQIESCDHADS